MKTRYKHLGFYSQVGDIREFINKSADEILDYWKKGYGAFSESVFHEEDCDIILEEETKNIASGYVKVTKDGKYLVSDGAYQCTLEEFENDNDGDDSEVYVDIYEKYLVEEDVPRMDVAYESCPYCGEEVELDAELKVQVCPSCGKHIVTCSMCLNDVWGAKCTRHCCLEIVARTLNGEKGFEEPNEEV